MLITGWKWKTRKIITPSPVASYESLVSVNENTDRKRDKKTRKKERKNMDRTKTKLNTPHVMHNVKILPQ